jgi:hypothetical protein
VKALFEVLERAMQLHEVCTEAQGLEDLRWKVKIEVNQDGGCTKFHDDLVTVRFAMTLAGDGTVLADNKSVDWNFYEASEGKIAALDDETLAPEDARSEIQKWNEHVSKCEVTTGPGDLSIMKGGKLNKKKPLPS